MPVTGGGSTVRNLSIVLLLLYASLPTQVEAGPCEDGFSKKGAVLTGLRYRASVNRADLAPPDAIGQLRGIALAGSYDVLDVEAEAGSMLLEQPKVGTSRPFPIVVTATASGDVSLEAKFPAGMSVDAAAARGELCAMLEKVKGGAQGAAAARAADAAVAVGGGPIAVDAFMFSRELSRETARGVETIPLRYKGKAYTIRGEVDYVIKDGDAYRVAYKIPDPQKDALKMPGQPVFKTDISCLMAKGNNAFTLTLKPGQKITLTGVYADFNQFQHIIWFSECRPE
jgi:hypothetical protein